MNPKVADIRSAHWRQTICECINRDPKLSKRKWCQSNGIRYRSLMYWQRKFQAEALERMENQETNLPVKGGSTNAPVFADVTPKLVALQAGQVSAATLSEEGNPSLIPELMIQAGTYRVYVNSSIQEATLEKVLRVICRA